MRSAVDPTGESAAASVVSETAPAEAPTSAEPPQRIGRYEVREHLGEGGMGVVWLAHDPELSRDVAVKLLRARKGPDPSDGTTRLLREAQALARLSHPNVIHVFDVGTHEGRVFMAMEYVPGQTLREWMRTRPPRSELLDAFVQAGRGLEAAHEAGLVHRDFKPANVLRRPDGRVGVVDFGLAAPPRGEAEATLRSGDGHVLDLRMTATGLAVGTPAYMSPEAHVGGNIDARSDQWSFCAALFEGLYGRRPFDGLDARELARRVCMGPPDPPVGAGVPSAIQAAVLRGLAVDPADRWPTMDALLRRLGPPRRSPGWWALGSVVAMTALVGLVHSLAGGPGEAEPCARAVESVAEVWNDDARASIREAFARSGVSYAEATQQRVVERLDVHARRLANARRDACEARPAREQDVEPFDRRAACLRRDLSELRELVGVLAEADASTVRHAIRAVGDLEEPEACAREAALAAVPAPPAGIEADVERIEDAMALARVTFRAGGYARARTMVDELLGDARALGYAPLTVEAQQLLGAVMEADGSYEEAEAQLVEALSGAQAAGLDELGARAATDLANVAGLYLRRPEEAERWIRHASASIERLTDPTEARIRLERTIGVVRQAAGEHEESRAHLQRALADAEARFGARHPYTLGLRSDYGLAHHHLGDNERAKEILQEVLVGRTDVYGPGHPDVSGTLGNLGLVEQVLGELDAAAAHTRRALDGLEASVGRDHPHYPQLLTNLANTEFLRGRIEDALALHEEAKALLEASVGPRAFTVGRSYVNIGVIHQREQRHEEARQAFRRGLEIFDEHLRPDHPERAVLLANLAHVDRDSGRIDDALAGFDRAVEILEAELGPDHPELGHVLAGRGHAHLVAEHEEQSLADFRRALAVMEGAEVGVEQVALMRHYLAAALWTVGRQDEGRRMMEQVRDELPIDDPLRGETERWLEDARPG